MITPYGIRMITIGIIGWERDYEHLPSEDIRLADKILDFVATLNQTDFRALKAARQPADAGRE